MTELDIGDVDAAATAKTLVVSFGPLAPQLAREQAGKCSDRPEISVRWHEIADAADTLVLANHHMELALDLLDTIGETSVPPHLDLAIVTMGIRKSELQPVAAGLGIKDLDARYLHQRTEQHLQLAEAEHEAIGKAVHLNAAARYATLREFALRVNGGDPVPSARPHPTNGAGAASIQPSTKLGPTP